MIDIWIFCHIFLEMFYITPYLANSVRETDVSRHNGGISGAPLKPLRDDSALRALSYYLDSAIIT